MFFGVRVGIIRFRTLKASRVKKRSSACLRLRSKTSSASLRLRGWFHARCAHRGMKGQVCSPLYHAGGLWVGICFNFAKSSCRFYWKFQILSPNANTITITESLSLSPNHYHRMQIQCSEKGVWHTYFQAILNSLKQWLSRGPSLRLVAVGQVLARLCTITAGY